MTSTHTYPLLTPQQEIHPPISRRRKPILGILKPMTPEQRQQWQQDRALKRREWATLDLRQQWTDESWMRQHLNRAGVRIAHNSEPATPLRMYVKLHKAGVSRREAREAVGLTLKGFLEVNPRLPLWAAVALVLEATGRFNPQGENA